jgi:hypothetical protein
MKKKRILTVLWVCFCAFSTFAQEKGIYSVLSVSGKITDRKTNKELTIGDKVNLQTELQFGAFYDKAVLISPSRVKYWLEIPESLTGQQLVVASQKALQSVRSKSIQMQGTRGGAAVKMASEGVSLQTLKDYFGADTFSIIGNTLKLPVKKEDLSQYKLVLRYENKGVKDILTENFTLNKAALNLGNEQWEIKECFVLLDNGKTLQPVTQIHLFFVDENRLLQEFAAYLSALRVKKSNTPKTQQILRQYCLDIYGNIDQTSLNQVIKRFFEQI